MTSHIQCLLLAVYALVYPAAFARAEGALKIEFDRRVYDFGVTDRVQRVTGMITFWNAGDAELQLRDIRTSCACTRATANPITLSPGQSGTLEFSINIGPSVGAITEQIFVSSNDPQRTNATLAVKLYVKPIFEVDPPQLRLGDIRPGATTNLTVLVKRTDGIKLRITKIVCDNPAVSTRVAPVKDSNGQAARIQIKYRAEANAGPFEDTLAVHTGEMYAEDLPKPSFEFSIVGRVTRPAR